MNNSGEEGVGRGIFITPLPFPNLDAALDEASLHILPDVMVKQ